MKRYKPLFDRTYLIICIITLIPCIAVLFLAAFHISILFIDLPILLLAVYFLVSPLFGYVELRENTLFIKYGLMLKEEIAYDRIRDVVKERKFYSDSLVSLKCAAEHVNIKYGIFDVTTVSVKDNDGLISDILYRVDNLQ